MKSDLGTVKTENKKRRKT